MKKQLFLSALLLALSFSSCSESEVIDGKDGIDGINGKDGIDGKDGTNGTNNNFQNSLVLFGDITNQEAKELIDNSATIIYEVIIESTTQLTEVNFSSLKKVANISIHNNKALEKVVFEKLETAFNSISISSNENLNSFEFPNLTTSRWIYIYSNNNLSSFQFPNLTTNGAIYIQSNENLSSFQFPNLTTSGDIYIQSNENLSSFEFPNLTTSGDIHIQSNENLSSFQFTKLATFESIMIYGNDVPSSIEKLLKHFTELTNPILEDTKISLYNYNPSETALDYINTLKESNNEISHY